MTPAEWAIVIPAIAAVSRIAAALEKLVKTKIEARRSDRPMTSASGDKMKAIALELAADNTVDKVNELHEALGQRDPLTRAYLIPLHLQTQTASLKVVEYQSVKQTQLLEKIASGTPPPKLPTRY